MSAAAGAEPGQHPGHWCRLHTHQPVQAKALVRGGLCSFFQCIRAAATGGVDPGGVQGAQLINWEDRVVHAPSVDQPVEGFTGTPMLLDPLPNVPRLTDIEVLVLVEDHDACALLAVQSRQ